MSLGITLSKDYKGPMEIAGYMRKVKSQYSLGKMISSYNKRYFILDLHYMQLYYLPKKESHYTDSQQIFLGEICRVAYDYHQVLNDEQVWKYGIIISARKKDYYLHSSSKEFIETLLFAFSHLIEYSTKEPLFNWEAYQKQIKKSEVKQFVFSPQGTISLNQQNQEILPSTPTSTSANVVAKKNDDSKKSLIDENQSPKASDQTSAPSSQTEAQEEETVSDHHKNETISDKPQIQTSEASAAIESIQVVKVDSTSTVTRMENSITKLRPASRNRGRNNSMSVANNQQIANFIQNGLIQTENPKNSDFVGINQADLSQIKPKENTNNIWENPTTVNARSRYPSLEARQRNKAALHHRAKLMSFRGSGISIESPELSKQSNLTPETNNSSPPKSSCDEDNQIPSNNEDWDKELFEDDDKKMNITHLQEKPNSKVNPESYNFRPAVPVHNDWDDELDL